MQAYRLKKGAHVTIMVAVFACSSLLEGEYLGNIPGALTGESFSEIDPTGTFQSSCISPKSLQEGVRALKARAERDAGLLELFLRIFGIPSINESVPDDYLSRKIFSLWSVCFANAENNPFGANNLLVYTDPEKGEVGAIDFLHTWTPGQDQMVLIRKIFGDIRLPTQVFLRTYVDGAGREVRFGKPHGITTDGAGTFWISDRAEHRIIQVRYRPDLRQFAYSGSVLDLDDPGDLRFYRYRDGHSMLFATNQFGNFVTIFGDPMFEGEKSLHYFQASQAASAYKIGDRYITRPTAIAPSDFSEGKGLYVVHDGSMVSKCLVQSDLSLTMLVERQFEPEFSQILSIDADSRANLYFVDVGRGTIGKCDRDLNLLYTTGGASSGETPGETGYNQPRSIYIDKKDNRIYISERWYEYRPRQKNSWVNFGTGSAPSL